jgi:hypothetical protein
MVVYSENAPRSEREAMVHHLVPGVRANRVPYPRISDGTINLAAINPIVRWGAQNVANMLMATRPSAGQLPAFP